MNPTAPVPSTDTVPAADLATRVPELLAPAGDWECARAAVENGADAIYFGLDKFNARMRAHNFTEADLPVLMDFLHRRGVRGYVTFNTLVFDEELPRAGQYLRAIIAAGVDAAIVQDVGIARLIRRLSPDFPIHASTQMTITSAAGVAFARELGCNLVVLARECSLREIAAIHRATSGEVPPGAAAGTAVSAMPLEVFVHGALCVAYSGQCLTSEALGGRSANRGECAQACRLPYELVSDGVTVPLGDRRYLLSPQDLAGLEVLPELAASGVASLKIEGRLKSPEYVASITRTYRAALDKLGKHEGAQARANSGTLSSSGGAGRSEGVRLAGGAPDARLRGTRQSDPGNWYELEMAFSRGLYPGWFRGNNNQELAHARFAKKRGVYLGEIRRVQGSRVWLRLEAPLKPGDGVVFDAGRGDDHEEGGRVYELHTTPADCGEAETGLAFGHDAVDFTRVQAGDKLWKTDDPGLNRELRQTFRGDLPRFQRPVWLEVHGHAGVPLTLIVRDESGHVVRVDSVLPLALAERQPLTEARLREQLGRLGGTPFRLAKLESRLEGAVILPVSELNRLRREAVAELERLRAQPPRWTLQEQVPATVESPRVVSSAAARDAEIIALVRSLPQLEAALRGGVHTLYCDFENPKRYGEAVALVHTARGCAAGTDGSAPVVFVAPPRIFKTGEEWILEQVRSCRADGYLVRNYDHLNQFAGARRVGDFSLNVANALTAGYFMNRFGLECVTVSYDLNAAQLESLLRSAPPEWFEVTIHQHMPMFHMEHCVFCAFLSSGRDYRDCGRPCDRHEVRLRDRVGLEHPLKADVGCRNTVFNARAQTGAEYVGRLRELGVRRFRVEFVNESPEEVAATLARYRALLRGEITGSQLWRELKLQNQLGVTRGQMEGRS